MHANSAQTGVRGTHGGGFGQYRGYRTRGYIGTAQISFFKPIGDQGLGESTRGRRLDASAFCQIYLN